MLAEVFARVNTNKLVIVDDFERCSPDISPQDILGLLSKLKNEKNCQLIVITNDERLNEKAKEAYQLYKEKLFDREVAFNGSPEMAVELVFGGNAAYRTATDFAIKLKISNIRIVQRIRLNIDEIQNAIAKSKVKILPLFDEQIQSTLTLATWADLHGGDIAIDNLVKLKGSLSDVALLVSPERLPEKEKRALEFLDNIGYKSTDELDEILITFVTSGTINETLLKTTIGNLSEIHRNNELRAEIRKGWELFHATFDENKDAIVAQFYSSIINGIELVGVSDLSGPIEILRAFGASDKADKIIDAFFARKTPIVSDNEPMFFSAPDPLLQTRLEAYIKARRKGSSVRESVALLASGSGYTKADVKAVAAMTGDEIYNLLKEPMDIRPMAIFATLLKFQSPFQECLSDAETIKQNILQAAKRLMKEGPTNAYRIKCLLEGEKIPMPDISGKQDNS